MKKNTALKGWWIIRKDGSVEFLKDLVIVVQDEIKDAK